MHKNHPRTILFPLPYQINPFHYAVAESATMYVCVQANLVIMDQKGGR